MCSTPEQRIAAIGRAIDDLASDALTAYARGEHKPAVLAETAPELPAITAADQVVIRLAELWTRLAELDPEVARRLPGYQV